jgi:UMP-CMP kinase
LCKKLAEERGFGHISVGDLLRNLITASELKQDLVDTVRMGELIPGERLAPLIKSAIDTERENGSQTILLDGFPRSLDQIEPVTQLASVPLIASGLY